MKKPVIIGIGGPVGSGKTKLIEELAKRMYPEISLAAITDDIYTVEDARILIASKVLPVDRIAGVETGGCPHTAVREDPSMNFQAIKEMEEKHPDLKLIFLESGGDNLAATFSPDLVNFSIYIIDVTQGEKIPRKGGQGMIKSDLFIINKTDLAPYVGADLEVMKKDTIRFRGENKPFFLTNLKTGEGIDQVIEWIKKNCLLMNL